MSGVKLRNGSILEGTAPHIGNRLKPLRPTYATGNTARSYGIAALMLLSFIHHGRVPENKLQVGPM